MARKTKAEQERAAENEALAGKLAKLDEELGEFVVVNQASLDQYPRGLILAMSERLGEVSTLLEFFVVYGGHYCEGLQLRVRVSPEVLAKPESAYRHKDMVGVLGVAKLKEHLKATYKEVAEIVVLKRRIKKLEDQLEDERRERMASFYDRPPWGMTMMRGPWEMGR